MTARTSPRRFQVVIRLTSPVAVNPEEARAALEHLTTDDGLGWAAAAATVQDEDLVELRLIVPAWSGPPSRAAVVNRVRGLMGLDPRFARWIVDAGAVLITETRSVEAGPGGSA